MNQKPLRVAAISAVVVVFGWAVLLNLWVKSDRTPGTAARSSAAAMAPVESLADSIRADGNVDRLTVQEVEGIVIIRGRTRDQDAVQRINEMAKTRGFGRVANLIQIAPVSDDDAIAREAERQLGQARSLDGCRFAIRSSEGVVSISGIVQHELQKDLARELARRVVGVKEVRTDLRIQPTPAS